MNGKVSVVIPNYNRPDAAARCVRSILNQDYRDIEVIVVDDCSSKCVVAEYFAAEFGAQKNIKVIRNAKNRRSAGSRNAGAAVATGEYLYFLDDDNILNENTVGLLVKAISDGHCGIAAPLTVNVSPTGEKKTWATSFEFNPWTTMPKNVDADVPYDERFAKRISGKIFTSWYSPNSFMMRRSTFESVGGFDEWFGFAMDESDCCMRARKFGQESGIVADAVTWHHHYNDNGDMVLRKLQDTVWKAYRLSRNRIVFSWRHYQLWHILSAMYMFAPAITAAYFLIAVARKRIDIGFGFVGGYIVGCVKVHLYLIAQLCLWPIGAVGKIAFRNEKYGMVH